MHEWSTRLIGWSHLPSKYGLHRRLAWIHRNKLNRQVNFLRAVGFHLHDPNDDV